MKLQKKFLFIIILIISYLIYFQIPTFSNSITNQNIRIGLFFNSTALATAQLNTSNINLLNDNDIVIGTINNDDKYTIRAINEKIFLLDKVFSDLNTAFIEAQTLNGIMNNSYFVYLDADGYRLATFDNSVNSGVSSPKTNKNIGVFSSNVNPMIVYDDSLNIKFSNSIKTDYIRVQNKPYRGNISFKLDTANKLTVINSLPIEDYLYGVVAKEMPASWNKEALKAQAISARNYSVKNLNKYKKQGFDLCTTQDSQVYGGVDAENFNTNKAVDETRGILAYYNGEVAELYYHSSSGGKTENSENIWSKAVPYLRSVEDPYSLGSPNDYWEYKITKSELEKTLNSKGKGIGNLLGIRIDKVSVNGRVLKMTMLGEKGEVSLEKESIRAFLGYSNLKSSWFEINIQNKNNQTNSSDSYIVVFNDLKLFLNKNDSNNSNIYPNLNKNDIITSQDYLFQGKGYGHGLGMSQYGAKAMAEQGFKFDEILKYYFKGIDVY